MSEDKPRRFSRTQKLLVGAILLSAFTGIVIGYLRERGLDGSALLYIGVPTFIALVFAITPPAKSAVGATLKSLTFIILISGPLLQEGFVCMIMAAPIFYIVGALGAWPIDRYNRKKKQEREANKLNMFILPALLLVMSTEGVSEYTSFNRYNSIEHTEILAGSTAELKARLGATRAVPAPDSMLVKLFPRPDTINAQGLSVGSRHWVDVTYVKWIFWNEKRGSTWFEVVEHQPGFVRFKAVSDSSYLHSYLDWGNATVYFQSLPDNRTRVTWRIDFVRKLDPAWYVQPLQQYSVEILAETLIASLK